MSLNTAAPSYAAGQILTAAQLNDLQDGIQAAWTTYSCSWGATTTNPAIGNGTIDGRWLRIGKTIIVSINVTTGSTTTYGSGNYTLSLPVSSRVRVTAASVDIVDASANSSVAGSAAVTSSGATLYLACPPTTAGGYDRPVSPTVPITFAGSDQINVVMVYETT